MPLCADCGSSYLDDCNCGYGSADGFLDMIAGLFGMLWYAVKIPYLLIRRVAHRD